MVGDRGGEKRGGRTIHLERVFCMSARACWAVPSVILFRCLCWVLWRMFSIEGVVSASSLYQLMLLEDVGTGAELFPGNGLALLGLNLDFVLSRRFNEGNEQ